MPWQTKTVTIPVVIGTLCVIEKVTEKHLEKIPGSSNLAEKQIELTGTTLILRRTLSM